MILDALLQVSSAQAVTADAASEDTIDFGNVTPNRRIAVGEPMCYVMAITAVGTNTGSTKVQAIESAAAALTSPQIVGSLDLAAGDLVAGKVYIIAISQGIAALRYGGMYHDITGTVDYTVDAFLVPASMAASIATAYANGYSIS